MRSPPLISVRDLVIRYSRWGQIVTAIDGLSCDVQAGEWLLLVGHNGAGKSTLLKAIGGQVRATSGGVSINGVPVDCTKVRKFANMVFTVHQDPLLGSASLLTLYENLLVADPQAAVGKHSRSALMQRYITLLRPLGLDERMRQPVKVLSGGERQLLALTIARLRDVPIILLDEPISALDPSKAHACIREIEAMHKEGKTIIQVAHDISDLKSRTTRILTLDQGREIASAGGFLDA